ncbi:MAG: ribosome assembly RNA-binding protein YhbY [Lachnospiraceae bacterium]|jgi:RNA-binding protein|nr:ribosome assembly RNA-binding protein YhbY [Lachnospiraceae bacterium]
MNSKQRAYLKSLASNLDSLFQIGKNALTPDVTNAVSESFNTHELVKITVLKNCDDNINEMANALADRTSSTLVQVIGRKIVLYKPFKDDPQIVLPK